MASENLLIKNGKTVNEHEIIEQDVYIEGGVIKQLGKNLKVTVAGVRVIDANGLFILPGGIDPHTHMEFEFMGTTTVDDFYHGTKGAVAGGTTMIIDFAFPNNKESLVDTYHRYRQKADKKVCCDYALHMCIPYWNDSVKKDIEVLTSQYGINSYKMFMAYSFMLSDCELYLAMETCKKFGAISMVHAENGAVIRKNSERLLARGITGPEGHELSRPEDVEAEAVHRAAMIANQVQCPLYVVHVMSKQATLAVAQARTNGNRIIGETLAAALGSDGTQCRDPNFKHSAGHIISPPLRSDLTTQKFLMESLARNDLQLTGSDNCTHTTSQKEVGLNDFSKIPNGVNGVEDRMSVIWEKGVHTKIIDPRKFVSITSTTAAKIFNLYPRKGCIQVGSDADVVVWNPNKTRVISVKTHNQAVDFNIFEGMECHGVPQYVIVNGRVCVDDGKLKVVQGSGKYIETKPYPPFMYDADQFSTVGQ